MSSEKEISQEKFDEALKVLDDASWEIVGIFDDDSGLAKVFVTQWFVKSVLSTYGGLAYQEVMLLIERDYKDARMQHLEFLKLMEENRTKRGD